MKNIHIENSYNVWRTSKMKSIIIDKVSTMSNSDPEEYLKRSYGTMYIEWILHNIFYYISLPFTGKEYFKTVNERCKHVDLEEWTYY